MSEELWICPRCGRPFASPHQEHSCGVWPMERHFDGRLPVVRHIVDAFIAACEACGPVHVISSKTRIGIQVRMIFAALMTRKSYVRGHLVLAKKHRSGRFIKVETYSPQNHVHIFELRDPAEIDDELKRFICEAYDVGRQLHWREPTA